MNTKSFIAVVALMLAGPLSAQREVPVADSVAPQFTYADLAGLADRTPMVLRIEVRKQVEVEPERAPGLAPDHARLYIEARTLANLAGTVPVGESLRYLVDVPRDAKGKVPKLKKREMVVFARPVAGRPGELQLVRPYAQLPWDPATEAQLRPILAELVASDAPPRITGVRDALAVSGTLAGESETQIFLDTEHDGPVSITVARRPNMEPVWGVSWSEIVDQAARPPRPNSMAWYRLACALPARLPARANLATDANSRTLAARDYALVVAALGPCRRTLG